MNSESWIEEKLAELRRIHQFRSLNALPSAGSITNLQGREFINFSSNDYLDFLNRKELKTAAIEATRIYGTGSGSSRLVTGNLDIHEQLETSLARHKGYPAALLFGSGYLTNLGVISSLAGHDDVVFADRLVHASIIDAIRLSGAELIRFHHNDMDHLEKCIKKADKSGRRLIISESVFSMDGDLAPLEILASLAAEYNAMLMIDEAHATGVFGPRGSGLISRHQLQGSVNISMCTMSKGLGGYGGAVSCSAQMRDWLINKARSFIYTTALPPGICASSLAALSILEKDVDAGRKVLERADTFRKELNRAGFNTGKSASQIIPVTVGENETTVKLAGAMREHGYIVSAIRPPTVPKGTARLRFSVTLGHSEQMLSDAVVTLRKCADSLGI